ncbi:hypothetical protein LJC19_01805 [Oxalobacter sp. OttesenSCG-928-P03]|nr:hypothetical protein [Oxalobacter sp. OttesenSCG-928-P03]
MILLINNLYEVEGVINTYRDDIELMRNNVRKLDRIICHLGDNIIIPDNTFAILLPDSDIFVLRFDAENSPVEWVTRQYQSLKSYDREILKKQKPFFISGTHSGQDSMRAEKFLLMNL